MKFINDAEEMPMSMLNHNWLFYLDTYVHILAETDGW